MTRLLAAAFGMVLVAAACGDTSDPTITDRPAATSATTAPAPTAAPTTTTPPPTAPAVTTPPTTAPSATDQPTTTTAAAAPPAPGWTRLATTDDPPGRANPILVVAGEERAAYLHAGRRGGDTLGDLWRLDLDSGAWTQLEPEGPGPTPRFSHTGVWDERRSRLVVFSGEGRGFGDFFSDVWAYDPATNRWTELAPEGAGPPARYGSCAGYDSAGDRFLISHGFTDDGRFDDTWAFSLADNTWTDVTPSGARPGERCLHACAYDGLTGSLVLFGGQDNDAPFLGDTWVLADGAWSELAGDGPSPRKFPAMAATEASVVLFGGIGFEGRTDDTWATSGGSAWSAVAAGTPPPARESHAAAYDPGTASIVVFGGTGPDGDLADTWILSGVE